VLTVVACGVVPLKAQITLSAAAAAPVDLNFVTPLTGSPGVVAVQADGKVIVSAPLPPTAAGSQPRLDLVRLNANGSLDPSFYPSSGNIHNVEILRDGFILVTSTDAVFGGDLLVRLLPDGTVDGSFTPIHGAGPHILLADRRVLVAKLANNSLEFVRYNGAGLDPSYSFAPITLGPRAPGAFDPTYNVLLHTRTSDGLIMVAVVSSETVGTGVFGKNESKILRLLPDGTIDPTFATITVSDAIRQFVSSGGKLTYISTRRFALGSVTNYQTRRLNADGSLDASYRSVLLESGIPVPVVQLASDGSLFYAAAPSTRAIVHYDRDGAPDPEFSARFSTDVSFSRLLPTDDGRLFATGNFTQLNGTNVSFLARLVPDFRASATRLTNLSIRQLAGTGGQTVIVGFVIAGQGSKPILVRGVGPTLASFNVAAPLADPRLSLFDGAGALRLANDDWGDDPNASLVATTSASVGAFALPASSRDAAAVPTLSAGAFTLHVTNAGAASATGIALAEGYDAGGVPADYSAGRVVNFSARGNAGAAEATLIAGFTVSGPNVKRVLVRAVGRTLEQFGVTNTLADPQLALFSGSTAIAMNDNWGGNSDVSAASTATGAFPLGTTDAALLITLPPGSYTAQVTGVNGTAGTALVEVYEVR
jgi:hypothetical protein